MRRRMVAMATVALLLVSWVASSGVGSVQAQTPATTGMVYAMTNNPVRNEVIAYRRAADGTLGMPRKFDTAGFGSGGFENSDTGLVVGSAAGQSSPVNLGGGNDLVFAVNAGSDEISVFKVLEDGGLQLVDKKPSGGERPTSLTVKNNLLYVLNSGGNLGGTGLCLGGEPTITGFRVSAAGMLTLIPNSARRLSGGAGSGCAQISFNPSGEMLIVTEITTDVINTFMVGADGLATGPIVNQTTGMGPFGFTFDRQGRLLMTENGFAREGQGTVTSYALGRNGQLTPIGGSVPIGETDPCWFVLTPDGMFAFASSFGPSPLATVTNDASRRGTISSFRVGDNGALTVLNTQAAQVGVGAADLTLGGNGRYLYALNSVEGTIIGWQVGGDASLTLITTVGGLPANPFGPLTFGLASRDDMGSSAGETMFPQTGQSLGSEFLQYWQAHGGLPVFGYPISAEHTSGGRTVQLLERARFELHPENAAPYNVLLSHLGVEMLQQQGRDWHSFATAPSDAAHYFPETGHAITHMAFWQYWSSHGLEFDGSMGVSLAESVALFGYPISEPQMERNPDGDMVLTQHFERARFEFHPNNPAPYKVLLGRLGAELR